MAPTVNASLFSGKGISRVFALRYRDRALIKKHLKRFLAAKRVQFFAYKGKVKSKRIVEALDIQLNAFELACKLKGSFAPVQTEQTNRTVSVIVPCRCTYHCTTPS
jgi:hypothetical protein